MARIVLTGANGLLGNEVVRLLAAAGDEVVCVGRRRVDVADAGVTFVEADLARPLRPSSLPDHADAVIHLAQSEHFNEFPEGANAVFAVNVAAPVALLDWARGAGVASFVHASSGGLYGSGPRPFAETDPLQLPPRLAFYLATKHSAEQLADAYQQNFSVAALRYFFVYGIRQRPNMLIPRLVANVRAGQPLTLQGANGMCLNPVHVSDAAAATVAAVRRKARGVFNVAGPDTVSIRLIGEIIGRLVGNAPLFEQAGGAPGDLVGDTAQMRDRLHIPTVSVEDGLGELCGGPARR